MSHYPGSSSSSSRRRRTDKSRSRSRSPSERDSKERDRRHYSPRRDRERYQRDDTSSPEDQKGNSSHLFLNLFYSILNLLLDFDEPTPPPPPRISKLSFGFGQPAAAKISKPKLPIHMKLVPPKPKEEIPTKIKVASAFRNESDDEEVEEMPAECRMRMRNIGRDTPTSSGPNSFGKTKQGFCDAKKIFERNLRNVLDDES